MNVAPLVLARWLGPWAGDRAAPSSVERTAFEAGPVTGWLFAPRRTRPFGTYVVAPGLHHEGPDDPRMHRFCAALAASGLLVVAPRLRDFSRLAIAPRATDDLAAAFDHAESLAHARGLGAPALFSISFGSRPAIALAARPSHRARVASLVLFGGFVDFDATVRFAVDATREAARADPLNAPVVFLNLLPHLPFDGDRTAVAAALRAMVARTWGRAELKVGEARRPIAESIAAELGPRERALFLVACGLTPGASELLDAGLAAAGDSFRFADPREDLANVAVPVVVIHGRDDDVIPWQQAHAIAAALPAKHPCRVLVTGMAAHTGSALPRPGALAAEARTLVHTVRAIARAPAGEPIGMREALGLRPFAPAARDALSAIAGSEHEAKTRFGVSSLRILKPWLGLPAWLGRRRRDGRVPIYNFFNRAPAPRTEGYSVRVTHARDFRGGRDTYDGHLGTDFVVPVGTPVVAAAPGIVLRVANDWARGGLKVCVDHGEGLFATYNHLARALVHVGDRVARGQRVGLSGASGMEFALFFPWVAPHLHFNTWLGGEPADPFAREGELALWRNGNDPLPFAGAPSHEDVRPSAWSAEGVEAAIAACRDPALCGRMRAVTPLDRRGAEVLVLRSYHASAFDAFPALYASPSPRRSVLDLPFPASIVTGAVA